MSGTNLHGTTVTCSACDGAGKRKGLTAKFEVKTVTCEMCHGTGKMHVTRKTA